MAENKSVLKRCKARRGCRGHQGPQGEHGEDGPQGQRGPQGFFDGTLPNGMQGNDGSLGNQGSFGLQGQIWFAIRGWQGQHGIDFIGPHGWDGFQGKSGPQGVIDTSQATGFCGIQGKNAQQGYQGDNGVIGFQGVTNFLESETGAQGFEGPQGFMQNDPNDGFRGLEGPQGEFNYGLQGMSGSQGDSGVAETGPQGYYGLQGAKGSDGENGTQGATGFQGLVGSQGFTFLRNRSSQNYVTITRFSSDQTYMFPEQGAGRVVLCEFPIKSGSGTYCISTSLSVQSFSSTITDPIVFFLEIDDIIEQEQTLSLSQICLPFFMHTFVQNVTENSFVRLSWQQPNQNTLGSATDLCILAQNIG